MSSHRVGGWEGLTAKFVVGNRAQRCERHKLARFLVGGRDEVLRADFMSCRHFGQNVSARIFERPPSHPALFRQRVF